MTIAVFGATGHLGALALDALLARGVAPAELRALGRDETRLAGLAGRGLSTARVDLDDPATLQPALAGIDTVLLISSSEVGRRAPQHTNAIDAALAAGAKRIVYTSAPRATTSALVLAPEHKYTEELLAERGVARTILRNGWYNENYVQDFEAARTTGVIANSVAEGRIASAARADYAEAAAVVLTTDGHDDKVYELSGDTAWSYADFAAAATRVLGREVAYQAVSPDAERSHLAAAGLPADLVGFLSALNANSRDGLVSEVTSDLTTLIGRPTTTIEESMRSWL